MSFEAHSPNIQNLQDYLSKEKEKRKDFDGPTWWSIPSGTSSIRILPPWDPTGRVAIAVSMHPIQYKTDKMKYTKYNWTCVSKTFGKPCPICEGLAELSAQGVDVSKYEATRTSFYLNAIVMYDPQYEAGIQAGKKPEDCSGVPSGTHVIMRAPKTLYDWIISQITNPLVGDITSLTQGIDVYVSKEGSGLGTSYTPTLSPNGRTAVPEEILNKIENLYNLDEIFSTGFDKEQIDDLVASIRKSAGGFTNIPNVVQNMAGYQQAPVAPVAPQATPASPYAQTPVAPPSGMNGVAPSPYQTGAPTVPVAPTAPVSAPVAPSMPQTAPVVPVAPVAPAPSVAPPANPTETNLPKCYGNYDPQQVHCVICPAEVSCSQNSKK